jgi:hypothetical protein
MEVPSQTIGEDSFQDKSEYNDAPTGTPIERERTPL